MGSGHYWIWQRTWLSTDNPYTKENALRLMVKDAETAEEKEDLAKNLCSVIPFGDTLRMVQAMGIVKTVELWKYFPETLPKVFFEGITKVLLAKAADMDTSFAVLARLTEVVSGDGLKTVVDLMTERAVSKEDWEAVYAAADTGSSQAANAMLKILASKS